MSEGPLKLPMVDDQQSGSCCAGHGSTLDYENISEVHWVTGKIETEIGPIHKIATSLDSIDLLGSFKTRWSVGRMSYTIPPGLYAAGSPDHSSPVLVSANYKLSFDALRKELSGLDLWILVIDTKGVNVWCAAGKGTFGIDEVVRMINTTRLSELVSSKILILPQLSAPGVSAFEVRRHCGFKVIFGPVRAADIPAFLKAGYKADPDMRSTYFGLVDRLILTPVELAAMVRPLVYFALVLLLLNLASVLIKRESFQPVTLVGHTFFDLVPFIGALLIGAVLVPALIPYIPGRALSWKGCILGLGWAGIYKWLLSPGTGLLEIAPYFLLFPAISAFLAMNFTGSTTYTSLSGVVKEMKIAFPMIVGAAALGLLTLIAANLI